ncbi:uroporphyrinogen decarboxylase family protein [Streptococcus sp. DD13]|uniref:uroporphyrinogen decarboxylase family protein n=1 Tax=Streptococcus sp. DD13 TaxID=1777881 RepID=UPI00079A5267|nr:uroporphyrinogen decarboxylase family protein [Streptococcus sp. DD13]KXT77564.1 Uroporphyrinogen decarboxylase (URO-D) [Streptococcus sp. DD13]
MDKNEKIRRVIEGEWIGEVPFSFWTHLPEIDRNPEQLAQATVDLYRKYDLDLIKTLNNGMYATEDYGCEVDYSAVATGGVAKIVKSPITCYEDWANLPELELETAAVLQRELDYLKRTLDLLDGEVPVLMTIFSPLTTAAKLAKGNISDYIAQDREGYLHQALERITSITAALAAEAIRLGAAGIYFASQMSSYDLIGSQDYERYGRPYDLQVLAAAKEGWANALHAHGTNILFELLSDYPVALFNWHVWESLPEPKQAQFYTRKTILGGLNRMDVTQENYNDLYHQIYRVLTDTGGKGVILTPGCVVRHPFSEETIRFMIRIKKETEQLLFEHAQKEKSC